MYNIAGDGAYTMTGKNWIRRLWDGIATSTPPGMDDAEMYGTTIADAARARGVHPLEVREMFDTSGNDPHVVSDARVHAL